jgi:hypothetical protein
MAAPYVIFPPGTKRDLAGASAALQREWAQRLRADAQREPKERGDPFDDLAIEAARFKRARRSARWAR